ncbi:amino acid synthesis family protein [Bradyrhizobium sp. RDM4]|uniref:amino acid synthesis family protein n=1 Tax=Bradyrhizobium sp. RDM4 TaxID=3378765 RepID=UPI0038FC74D0
MNLKIRRKFTLVEDKLADGGGRVDLLVRKAAVVLVVENPYTSSVVKDLSPLIEDSVRLGQLMGEMVVAAMGECGVQSYGKGGLVGFGGEQEHANALLTTAFANPIRQLIGGAEAWISSMTKVVAPDTTIDIPMNHKDDVYVRSHYDGMTLTLSGTPMHDEIALVFVTASGGRINARVGGLTHDEVAKRIATSRA